MKPTINNEAIEVPVSAAMTVNETVQSHPETLPVFRDFGIDACCGGSRRIDDVAQRHQLDLRALLEALNQAAVRFTQP